MNKIVKTASQWQTELSPEEYKICREKRTEPAFSGKYWQMKPSQGDYTCRCCEEPLFSSSDKFDSGSGWPSFTQPRQPEVLQEVIDKSHAMQRTEIVCARCDAHLGHVFPDGPSSEGLRYCINSASLQFVEDEQG